MPGGMKALKDIRLYKKRKEGGKGRGTKRGVRGPSFSSLREVGAKLKASYTSSLRPHTLVP